MMMIIQNEDQRGPAREKARTSLTGTQGEDWPSQSRRIPSEGHIPYVNGNGQ